MGWAAPGVSAERPPHTARARALLQLTLGMLQMLGAVVSAILLSRRGATPESVGVAFATTVVAVCSRVTFRTRRPPSSSTSSWRGGP